MSFEDQDERAQAEREERLRAKHQAAQFRKDVQDVLGLPAARRVLFEFLTTSGVDVSALRHDNLATGHAIGWADAAGWWLNTLRTHCPEREVQMRNEAREAARPAPQDDTDD